MSDGRRAASADGLPKPFLKWAGGKTQILPELLSRLPRCFAGYHEPFVGGGALFFALARIGRLAAGVTLSDVNPALIDAYAGVRDHVGEVIAILGARRNDADEFYRVRAQDPAALPAAERAARIVYLNRTCFNGLYRENRSGRFNVPFGRYKAPRICDEAVLRAASAALRGVDLAPRPFEAVLERARPGDLAYFDPPYDPVSATASFTAYARGGFGAVDQERLRDVARELAGRGVHVLLSNSATPLIRGLYGDADVFRVAAVSAVRAINSRGDRRGPVREVIVRAGPGIGRRAKRGSRSAVRGG
jgi:DNA adenine methylase